MLMKPNLECTLNIGSSEYITVDQLVDTAIEVLGKRIHKKNVEGPVCVQARKFSKVCIHSLGGGKVRLREGIARKYAWIEAQVKKAREGDR
jgi:hypothetical protein